MRLILTAVLLSSTAAAQSVPPALMVQRSNRATPLRIAEVKVEARLHGFIAETSMTLRFANPNDRQVAGDLYFPLPEGSTVSGYALDVQGQLVDGVVVEKEQARVAFEKEVRKGVDPGLVEWTKGNVFKTRVFPIPAKGSRTVRVDYVGDLSHEAGAAAYRLPLNFSKALDKFTLRIDVVGKGAEPQASWRGPKAIDFGKVTHGYFAEVQVKKQKLTGDLSVRLPASPDRTVVVESWGGDVYFAINDAVTDPRTDAQRKAARPPRRIGLLWDASGSRATADIARELKLLETYLKSLGRVEVELVVLRNTASSARRFGDIRSLLSHLRALPFDGGTQLGSLRPLEGIDAYVMFSDGLSNFGEHAPPRLNAPVFTLSSTPNAHHPILRWIAEQSGGAYFNLGRLGDKEVLRDLGRSPFALLSATAKEGALRHTYPKGVEPVHGRFTFVGKLMQSKADVTLKFGVGTRNLHEQRYTINGQGAPAGDLLARTWAQRKVAELSVFPERNHQALVSLGQQFGMVTPGTSLIVFETLAQYVEHDIRPPASLKQMRAQWDQTKRADRARAKREHQDKLDRIISLWQERVKWWNTEFDYPPDYRHRAPKAKKSRAAPDARPPPASAPAMEMAEAEPMEDVADKREKKDGSGAGDGGPSISLKAWKPDTPYLRALESAATPARFATYMKHKKEYGGSPAFYLDCSDFFLEKGERSTGMQVLSNVAEMELENAALLRILGHRLAQHKELALAALIFEEVLRLRGEEPQSYRDLGLVLAQLKRYERALELLAHVVMHRWDRFAEIELMVLLELNHLIPRARAAGIKKIPLDIRLIKALDLDVRIVLSWDADLTDIDLWVIEPSGQKAYYGDNRTRIGGLVSRDFTQGYGPEEYLLRRAMKGEYNVQVNFYGSQAQSLSGAVTLQLDLYTHYGRKNEKRQSITVRLKERSDTLTIGTLKF